MPFEVALASPAFEIAAMRPSCARTRASRSGLRRSGDTIVTCLISRSAPHKVPGKTAVSTSQTWSARNNVGDMGSFVKRKLYCHVIMRAFPRAKLPIVLRGGGDLGYAKCGLKSAFWRYPRARMWESRYEGFRRVFGFTVPVRGICRGYP